MKSLILVLLIGLLSGQVMAQNAHPSAQWPIEFKRGSQQFSSNFGQYQWLGARYFHAGLDILAVPGQPLFSPVAGRIEAGYYEYKDRPDGHYYFDKKWTPLKDVLESSAPLKIDDFRFEVAIVSEDGFRFELHHADPQTLPESIRQAILNGEQVDVGVIVGYVKFLDVTEFGAQYTHVHYNVVSPEGVHLNPQAFSPQIPDSHAPKILNVYAGPLRKCNTGIGDVYKAVSKNNPVRGEKELIVRASDHLDGNKIAQAPTKLKVHFRGHPTYQFDFSNSLLDDRLSPIPVHQIYQKQFCLETGLDRPFQMQGSTIQNFYFRVPIPEGYAGEAVVEFGDFQDNWTRQKIEILGQAL